MPKNSKNEGIKNFISGTLAGFVGKIIEYPPDLIKVKLQTSRNVNSSITTFQNIIRADGFAGLYRGLSTPLVSSMAENAIVFSAYSKSMRYLKRGKDENEIVLSHSIIAGMVSGASVSLLLTPVELIKCRIQASLVHFDGPLDCLRKTIKYEGIRSLYTGHTGTMMREVPGSIFYFGSYELVCKFWCNFTNVCSKDELSPLHIMTAGSLAGMSFWSSIFWADTVKSRMQTFNKKKGGSGTSFISTLKHIVKNEGFRSLFKGLGVTLFRSAPSNAALFCSYEMFQRLQHTLY